MYCDCHAERLDRALAFRHNDDMHRIITGDCRAVLPTPPAAARSDFAGVLLCLPVWVLVAWVWL